MESLNNTETHTTPTLPATAGPSDNHNTIPASVYDTRPPQYPFVDNTSIAAMAHQDVRPIYLPLQVKAVRQFHHFSINATGNFARQVLDRVFTCTICQGVAREITPARSHHTRYHKNHDFETVTREARRERWKADPLPEGDSSDESSEEDSRQSVKDGKRRKL